MQTIQRVMSRFMQDLYEEQDGAGLFLLPVEGTGDDTNGGDTTGIRPVTM